MYLLLIALGMVVLMHSFVLLSVIRKNDELSKKVDYIRRSLPTSPYHERKVRSQPNGKHSDSHQKKPANMRTVKGERPLQ